MGISSIAKSIENIHKCRAKYLKCRKGNYYIKPIDRFTMGESVNRLFNYCD